jgi:hypothetical protein
MERLASPNPPHDRKEPSVACLVHAFRLATVLFGDSS